MKPEKHKILLVDDDEFQIEMMAVQLAGIGWRHVIRANSGAEALVRFAEHGAAVVAIISDVSMPDMDGLVLMRRLTQCGFLGGVILVSGLPDDILNSAYGVAQAHGLNILGCLRKPCDPAQLHQFLESLLPPVADLGYRRHEFKIEPGRLEAALVAAEFVPWYQPKIDLHSGAVVGVEALARWPQADGGMISPGDFVPAIEAGGLADDLFFAMAGQVAADLATWRSQGIVVNAAINLSMETAHNLEMPERLLGIVTAAGLSPKDFVIEVTESRLMVDRAMTMESLTRLSVMGFTLSIDDFGTGYSSLIQLIDLPFKELKIDGSFVQRASQERKAQTAVCLSLTLGMTLKMDVVAEGVETEEQLAFVRDSGGRVVQGYHLARPMPFATCTQWLTRLRILPTTRPPLGPGSVADFGA